MWDTSRRNPEIALDDGANPLVEQRLQRAIDAVSEDAALVELWACALSGFAQPVPDHPRTAPSRLPRAPNIAPTPVGNRLEIEVPKRP
jgi:hypothetical protein